METKKIILIAAAAVVLLIIIALLCSHFSSGNRKGRAAEKKVAKALAKLGKKDKVRIINNAFLPLYNKTCEIDHLVFGRFGVLVVETKGISGKVSGSGKKLTHTIGLKVHKLYNPQLQNKTHLDNVTHHLKKGGFDRVPVTGAVVFTDKDIVLDGDYGIKLDELERMYERLPDAGCNQDALYNYFSGLLVKNPFRKFMHKFSKKDWD
jgi:hypothetical protein